MIHKTAIISEKAKLGKNISVGAYAIITDNVAIGDNSKIGAHCLIDGNTTMGKDCQIYTGAVVGSAPQDLKYKGEHSFLEIGDNNIIREYCTLNPGTSDGGKTIIGNNNLLMAYSHVAHDCQVGNNCIFANNATLAGHVTVEDKAVIGGLVAVHQFVRVGMLSIIGGCSKVVQDIPPFSTCDGHPAKVYGLNLIGLRRHGIKKEAIDSLDKAFRFVFNSGISPKHAVEKIKQEITLNDELSYLLNFILSSERGLSRSCRFRSND
ncbi:MAG: acyl-ACP--UDP-N-acetylglucosamine O-acyltransferase [Candidatus Omnitrophica bacterium]|jgi:UDP-N-acetylglucosamine acyltransferase|nr:acyl-ACP--UDP-N-acetylglucosamine O-acyltransferase [Candidatus Omnitrophota bacterium]